MPGNGLAVLSSVDVALQRYAQRVGDPVDSAEFAVPLYTQREAAELVGVPTSTLRNWAHGYSYKTLDGTRRVSDPMVTTVGPRRGPVVPFVGLGEAYVLAAFRRTGVPMQRIRPAIQWLEQHIGLRAALTSERLMTDGAELLWEFASAESDAREPVGNLVVIRNQQVVFRDVVSQYLRTISYREGRVGAIRLQRYQADVVVDPRLNFGQPTLAARGVRVRDVIDRLAAGEAAPEVAEDYGLDLRDVRALQAA